LIAGYRMVGEGTVCVQVVSQPDVVASAAAATRAAMEAMGKLMGNH
jgi:hypothetical protein